MDDEKALPPAEAPPPEAEPEEPPWRGWHVIGRFLPLIFLGTALLVFGLSPAAPHTGRLGLGIIFDWVGCVLWVSALVGMVFTKCPICYRTTWVFCSQEPDVVRLPYGNAHNYGRDLARMEREG